LTHRKALDLVPFVWEGLDEAEAVGHLPPCGYKLVGSLLGIPNKPHSFKKGQGSGLYGIIISCSPWSRLKVNLRPNEGHGYAPINEALHRQEGGWMQWGGAGGTGPRELINKAQPRSGFKGGGSRVVQALCIRQLRYLYWIPRPSPL
jgi:hypothetical protein